ncbi:MAG: hypothetical protein IJK35_00785 [Oscillospiraceae bacterium]|nr:hypothetical protein [Oscillospiraceae bacterium]
MTTNNKKFGRDKTGDFLESFVFLFIPYVVFFVFGRIRQVEAGQFLPLLIAFALFLMLLSTASLYADLCLAAAFSLLGLCASSRISSVSPAGLLRAEEWGSVLYLLPLFAAAFCGASVGRRAIREIMDGGSGEGCMRKCLGNTVLLISILLTGCALSCLIYIKCTERW